MKNIIFRISVFHNGWGDVRFFLNFWIRQNYWIYYVHLATFFCLQHILYIHVFDEFRWHILPKLKLFSSTKKKILYLHFHVRNKIEASFLFLYILFITKILALEKVTKRVKSDFSKVSILVQKGFATKCWKRHMDPQIYLWVTLREYIYIWTL